MTTEHRYVVKHYLTDDEWIKQAKAISVSIVIDCKWPWTDRQKRLWYIGVLADVFTRKALEEAPIEQLQNWHKELSL